MELHRLCIWDVLDYGHILEVYLPRRRLPVLQSSPNHNQNTEVFTSFFSVTNRKLFIQRKCLKFVVVLFPIPNALSFQKFTLSTQIVDFSAMLFSNSLEFSMVWTSGFDTSVVKGW